MPETRRNHKPSPASGARHVVLGVTGSIGAYKAADLVRRLRERDCIVTCVMTHEACEFITPLTLQVLSERRVVTDLFNREETGIVHTTLADEASVVLIAPATAQVIAKLAHGLADDPITCIALATRAPILLAPAMNVHMLDHPATQENLSTLRQRGCRTIGPQHGSLACGYDAVGHLSEVEEIVEATFGALAGSGSGRQATRRHGRS